HARRFVGVRFRVDLFVLVAEKHGLDLLAGLLDRFLGRLAALLQRGLRGALRELLLCSSLHLVPKSHGASIRRYTALRRSPSKTTAPKVTRLAYVTSGKNGANPSCAWPRRSSPSPSPPT